MGWTRTVYDTMGRPIEIDHFDGAAYVYDAQGQLAAEYGPPASTSRWGRRASERIALWIYSFGADSTYSGETGNKTQHDKKRDKPDVHSTFKPCTAPDANCSK